MRPSASSESDEIDTTTNDGDMTRDSGEGVPPEVAEGTAECSGAASEELLAALRHRGAASRQCFEALLERGTEASGQIKVVLEIAENGEVQTFDLEGDDVSDELFNECLAEHFKVTYEDSPPENGCVTVKIPLNFSVKKATAPEAGP